MKKSFTYFLIITTSIVVILTIYIKINYIVYRVKSDSMIPTLCSDDFILVEKKHKRIIKGGIYVFKGSFIITNNTSDESVTKKLYIKRLVASPGDTISISNKSINLDYSIKRHQITEKYSQVKINDLKLNSINQIKKSYRFYNNLPTYLVPFYMPKKGVSIYLHDHLSLYEDLNLKEKKKSDRTKKKEYTANDNYYFALGDNKNWSIDSRHFGPAPEESIIGRATYIIFSWSKYKPYSITRILKKIP